MRCVIALLLIPCMLASQLLCTAHLHLGTAVTQPDGHAITPHFHLESSHHHRHTAHHSHGHTHAVNRGEAGVVLLAVEAPPIDDHDADAVYCPESTSSNNARQSTKCVSGTQLSAARHHMASRIQDASGISPRSQGGLPPPFLDVHCPIFLRNLSIRC